MSASIPSVFNRYDFFGTVLPGYVLILVYLFIYDPNLLTSATASSSANYLDVLWAVIFLVAGPAIGLTLSQTLRIAQWYLWKAGKKLRNRSQESDGTKNESKETKKHDDGLPDLSKYSLRTSDFVYHWIRIHTKAAENQLNEFDYAEAIMDFDLTTGAGLVGLGLWKVHTSPWALGWADAAVVAGALLLLGNYYELLSFDSLTRGLWSDLNLKWRKVEPLIGAAKGKKPSPVNVPPPAILEEDVAEVK